MSVTKSTAMGQTTGAYTEPFGAWEQTPAGARHTPFRRRGIEHFTTQGLPTTSHEDWRFTSLAPLARLPFRPLSSPSRGIPTADQLRRLTFGGLPGPRLVFVDGHFAPELSRNGNLTQGLSLEAWSQSTAAADAAASDAMGVGVPVEDNPFAALNAAYFTDGALIRIEPGAQIQQPIHLLFVTVADAPGSTSHLRNLILVGRDSHVTVVESYFSLTSAAHVTNTVTELSVGDGARLEHLRFQDENPAAIHLATVGGGFGASSHAWLHSFALGARLFRANLRTRLAGEGLECILNGLYLTRGEQLADHHMVVEHSRPHCASHEYFNGILDDRSRGVFHGRILVHPEAQKTDAKQTNKNLLLSDEAQINTKPQLEIYADDVKCTHGATVGQLNQDSVFYLRSRGLDLETARRMLIHAFAGEIIDRVQSAPLREELDALIWDRLEQCPHLGAAQAPGPRHVR